jgi:YD repeat-containing protein
MSFFPGFYNGCIAQQKSKDLHVFYYSTVEFVETPLSPIKGSVPLDREEAMKRNHYRFSYNDKHQLVSVSFFNGNVPKDPNHTANLFTLAHCMKFEYTKESETISFIDTEGEPEEVLGNCSRFVYTYNDLGFRNGLYFLDRDNQQLTNSWGIYEYKWEYLEDGSVIEDRYDKEGNQVSIRPGFEFHRLRLYFNPSGHIALMQNIDQNGNLKENNTGASQDRITTNAQGNFLEWNVLNNKNELEKGNGPDVAIGKQTFNEYGYEVALEHQDEKGQVIASHYGIYRSRTKFDQFGNIQERTFYNAAGKPAKHSNAGYHKFYLTWDEHGNKRKSLRYFDEAGNPCMHKTRGYYEVRYEYDDQGRILKISYLSTENELSSRKDNGRAYSVYKYDKDGKVRIHHFNSSNTEIKS